MGAQENTVGAQVTFRSPVTTKSPQAPGSPVSELYHTWRDDGPLGLRLTPYSGSADTPHGVICTEIVKPEIPPEVLNKFVAELNGVNVLQLSYNDILEKFSSVGRPVTIGFRAIRQLPPPAPPPTPSVSASPAHSSPSPHVTPRTVNQPASPRASAILSPRDKAKLHLKDLQDSQLNFLEAKKVNKKLAKRLSELSQVAGKVAAMRDVLKQKGLSQIRHVLVGIAGNKLRTAVHNWRSQWEHLRLGDLMGVVDAYALILERKKARLRSTAVRQLVFVLNRQLGQTVKLVFHEMRFNMTMSSQESFLQMIRKETHINPSEAAAAPETETVDEFIVPTIPEDPETQEPASKSHKNSCCASVVADDHLCAIS